MGYVKRNFLTPMIHVNSMEELNKVLLTRCEKYAQKHKVPGTNLTIQEAWEEEKKLLLPLPARPFDCFNYAEVKANRSQLIRYENNFYSVPVMWAGRNLTLKAYVYRVEIYGNRQLVAVHPRCYGKSKESYCLDHHLDTLIKKPGALEHAKPFHCQWPSRNQHFWPLKSRHFWPRKVVN